MYRTFALFNHSREYFRECRARTQFGGLVSYVLFSLVSGVLASGARELSCGWLTIYFCLVSDALFSLVRGVFVSGARANFVYGRRRWRRRRYG